MMQDVSGHNNSIVEAVEDRGSSQCGKLHGDCSERLKLGKIKKCRIVFG